MTISIEALGDGYRKMTITHNALKYIILLMRIQNILDISCHKIV